MIWRPKRGPVLTWGRAQHVMAGAIVTLVCGMASQVWYDGIGWGMSAAALVGIVWEAATPILAPRLGWEHASGDILDLLAYFAGVVAVALPVGLIGAG